MPGQLIRLDDIRSFTAVKDAPLNEVTEALRLAVKQLHEADDMEEFLRAILSDRAATPHGPAELVDILTNRVEIDDQAAWGPSS